MSGLPFPGYIWATVSHRFDISIIRHITGKYQINMPLNREKTHIAVGLCESAGCGCIKLVAGLTRSQSAYPHSPRLCQ
jgi:hypothetical protein